MNGIQLVLFDYNALDADTRSFVETRTARIHLRIKRSAQDIVEIGDDLGEVKSRLGHGLYGSWLKAEFEWSQDTASNFVRVASKFRNFRNLDGFAPSALYLLSAPSTPDDAVEEAMARAENGERITYAAAKEIVYRLPAANHALSDDPDYDGDEWYTPIDYIEAARRVMGEIDLDPASCDEAQARICAKRYLTKEDDALREDIVWSGRVWLNPPYSTPLIRMFVVKLIRQYESGNVAEAIILTNNSSDTGWFHDLLSRYPACFTRGRAQFWRAGSVTFGARQGQTIFYLGDNDSAFVDEFSRFGQVVVKHDHQ